jgi:hypothetical protein
VSGCCRWNLRVVSGDPDRLPRVEKIFGQEEKSFFHRKTIEEIAGTLVSIEPEIGNSGSAPRD